jgi:hypothetical protein
MADIILYRFERRLLCRLEFLDGLHHGKHLSDPARSLRSRVQADLKPSRRYERAPITAR